MKLLVSFFAILVSLSACVPSPNNNIPTVTATIQTFPTLMPSATQTVTLNACVINEVIRIRRGPGTEYEVIGGLAPKACITILGRDGDATWVYIVTNDNITGWVASSLLTVEGNVDNVSLKSVQSVGVSPFGVRPTATGVSIFGVRPTSTNASLVGSIAFCSKIADQIDSNMMCKVERAYCVYRPDVNSNPTFCNEKPYPDNIFQLVVFGEDCSDYDGHCIIITGFLETYFNGQQAWLQIIGNSRSQVSYC